MQGFNMGRYVPPDQEGIISGNALNKKHPLGSRASKLASHGILTVRFEMPFAVWCSTCPKPTIIGQGVRFNAEKKRVGYYHSSPIFSFRIKHTACGGEIEIRTDPQNTRYVVVSGGKARDVGDKDDDDSLIKGAGGHFGIPTPEERADLRESAFGKLEKTIADREKLEDARQRIGELQDAATRQWDDPYAQNQRLRKAFRVDRHKREDEAARTEDLRDRMSLGIRLLPGTEEDARRAALVDFGRRIDEGEEGVADHNRDDTSSLPSTESTAAPRMDKILARPLFEEHKPARKSPSALSETTISRHPLSFSSSKKSRPLKSVLKSEIAASRARKSLISEISGNTRAAMDPFLDFDFRSSAGAKKRKRTAAAVARLDNAPSPTPTPPPEQTRTINTGANNSPALSPDVSDIQEDSHRKREKIEPPAFGSTVAAISSLVSYDSDSDSG